MDPLGYAGRKGRVNQDKLDLLHEWKEAAMEAY